jgi:hypothetical protein
VEQLCKPLPPLPPPIPACNATNYHEFWCTVTNVSESFSALATRLHVNPTKLCEYNFRYDCSAGVTPNYSIRVPYDQCTPKPGGWNCYEVTDGDTLLTVAASDASVNLDALALKNTNLDILYGDTKLYAGQQLRLPIHNCFPDEISDCHTVASAKETLQSVASIYSTTAQKVCNSNALILRDKYCDPSLQPLPNLHVGMELTVPRLHATSPSPCKDIPGYWSCYTVEFNDTMFDIGNKIGAGQDDLILLNYGEDPKYCGDCSNITECPTSLTDKQRGPNCLRVGLVLTVAVNECIPKPGAWNCVSAPDPAVGFVGLLRAVSTNSDWSTTASPPDVDFFCRANRRSLPGCRNPSAGLIRFSERIWLKAPIHHCIPNAKSFCAAGSTFETNNVAGPYGCAGCALQGLLADWDGNSLAIKGFSGITRSYGEYHSPRGSLPGLTWQPTPSWYQVANCTPTPGEYICHKPQAATGAHYDKTGVHYNWTDSVDNIAEQFGLDPHELCAFNNLSNCSEFSLWCSALKIPVNPR